MIVMDDFQKLLKQVEEIKQRRDKAAGAVEQLIKRLKADFGCESLGEAKRKLKELEEEERQAFTAYNQARKVFDRKWKEKLEKLK